MIARIWDGMTEGEGAAVADELRRVGQGDAWHGPALAELLGDVSPERAVARPIPGAHSIWELVLHLAAWDEVWCRRLEGHEVGEPEDGDFPPASEPTPDGWAGAQARLRAAHGRLVERVARLTGAELDATVPGRDYSRRFLARGAIRHAVYHGGQIALLKKAG